MNMVKWLTRVRLRWQRSALLAARQQFFDLMVQTVSAPTDRVALRFGQNQQAAIPEVTCEPAFGTLFIHFNLIMQGKDCSYAWSIYQTGQRLRIAVSLGDDLTGAPLIDWNREILSMWPGVEYSALERTGMTLYEWSFDAPEIYMDFAAQEGFALNLRHCHFRMLRIIEDFLASNGQ